MGRDIRPRDTQDPLLGFPDSDNFPCFAVSSRAGSTRLGSTEVFNSRAQPFDIGLVTTQEKRRTSTRSQREQFSVRCRQIAV